MIVMGPCIVSCGTPSQKDAALCLLQLLDRVVEPLSGPTTVLVVWTEFSSHFLSLTPHAVRHTKNSCHVKS